jgi:small conductance mechanosensitive channel
MPNKRSLALTMASILTLQLVALGPASQAQTNEPSGAQEAPSADDQVEESAALVDKIRETDSSLVELIQKIPTATGEDLDLVRSQISDLADQQREDLFALTRFVLDRQAAGDDVALLEQETEQLLRRSSRRLRSYIQTFRASLEEDAKRRPALEPNEVQVFEQRMAEQTARLDRYFLELVQVVEKLEDLGLDTAEERNFLERELAQRGENLLQVLTLTKTRLAEYRVLLEKSPDDTELQAQVFATEERYEANKTGILATVHMMKLLGLDYVDLEVSTIELTGEITPDALEVEIAVGFAERMLQKARVSIADRGPRFLLRAIMIVGILLLFWILARIARHATNRVMSRRELSRSQLLREVVVRTVGRLVLLFGVIVALSQLGINLGPVLAGLGIAGFIVGFALQDTLANFAAGAMILAYRPFDIDDLIETAGITGKVKDMNLVSTRILTPDFQTLIVPNAKIWGDVIRNVTAQPARRVDLVFGISYEDEIPKAERVLSEIVAAHQKILADPEPVIKLHTLNDSSVDFVVRPWAKTDDYWDVYWDITREVKLRFDAEGISIPYPQRDVHLITKGGDETGNRDAGT